MMNAICSTTVPVLTQLHWSTDPRPVWVAVWVPWSEEKKTTGKSKETG